MPKRTPEQVEADKKARDAKAKADKAAGRLTDKQRKQAGVIPVPLKHLAALGISEEVSVSKKWLDSVIPPAEQQDFITIKVGKLIGAMAKLEYPEVAVEADSYASVLQELGKDPKKFVEFQKKVEEVDLLKEWS